MEKVKELRDVVQSINQNLQNQEFILNYTGNAEFQNALIENEDLKQQFLTLSSFQMFLQQVYASNPDIFDIKSQLNEALEDCDEEKRSYKDAKENSEPVFLDLAYLNDLAAICFTSEMDFEHVEQIKKKCVQLTEKIKQVSTAADGKCHTMNDLSTLISEQVNTLHPLNKSIQQHIARSTLDPEILKGLDDFLNVATASSFSKTNTNSVNTEVLSGVKIIASQPECEILEIFYTNTSFKKSSVEVQIIFFKNTRAGRSRGAIKNVVIRNNPVNVDDLIAQAIETSDFATVLPFLQHRLSES